MFESRKAEEAEMAKGALYEKAETAVKTYLHVDDFIEKHSPEIYAWLERRYVESAQKRVKEDTPSAAAEAITDLSSADEAEGLDDVMFIAESLPVISGIIHVGSRPNYFKDATEWIKKEFPDADANPASVLSALTFIYVVEKAQEYYKASGNEEKRRIWEHICKQVKNLLELK
jgi:hypothetical protein